MRRIVWVSLFALLVTGASAQRQGGVARGVGHGGYGFRPVFPAGRGYGRIPSGYGYGYLGGDYSPYDFDTPYAYSPQPVILMPPPPLPPPVVEPPPAPARPVVTDYKWPAAGASAPAEAELQPFAIVLKDGSTLAATTVMASNDVLHYVDPDERHMRVSMSAVDRAATLKVNRERKLNLHLPASP